MHLLLLLRIVGGEFAGIYSVDPFDCNLEQCPQIIGFQLIQLIGIMHSFRNRKAPTHFRSCTLTPETVHPNVEELERIQDSEDRQHVAGYLQTGKIPSPTDEAEGEKAIPQDEKEDRLEDHCVQAEKEKPKPVTQQLSEATRRVRDLEEQLQTMQADAAEKCNRLQAEWRAKCISLAQRLERTEAEIPNPRAQDVAQIKDLEGQVRSLMAALNSAAKEKLLQNPGWRPERPSTGHSSTG